MFWGTRGKQWNNKKSINPVKCFFFFFVFTAIVCHKNQSLSLARRRGSTELDPLLTGYNVCIQSILITRIIYKKKCLWQTRPASAPSFSLICILHRHNARIWRSKFNETFTARSVYTNAKKQRISPPRMPSDERNLRGRKRRVYVRVFNLLRLSALHVHVWEKL